jgi:predicted oxidoreductase
MSLDAPTRTGSLRKAFPAHAFFPLAYGCWRLAGSEGGPKPAGGDRSGIQAVHAAYDTGYNLFDLADIYGRGECERIFGLALRERPGMRDRILILSKCGIRPPGTPDPGYPYRYDFNREYIVRSVEGSLRRMGIGRLDILLLHRPDYLMDPDEVAAAFAQLLEQGKVKEFGVSNFRPSQCDLLQRSCPMPLVTHQIEASLLRLDPFEDGALDYCLANRLTPMAWSPLARGRLGSFDASGLGPDDEQRIAGLRILLDRIGQEHGADASVVALAWLLRHPANLMPVVGSTNAARIRGYTQAAQVAMSRENWYRLFETARGTRLP